MRAHEVCVDAFKEMVAYFWVNLQHLLSEYNVPCFRLQGITYFVSKLAYCIFEFDTPPRSVQKAKDVMEIALYLKITFGCFQFCESQSCAKVYDLRKICGRDDDHTNNIHVFGDRLKRNRAVRLAVRVQQHVATPRGGVRSVPVDFWHRS